MFRQVSASISWSTAGEAQLRIERWELPDRKYPEWVAGERVSWDRVSAAGGPERFLRDYLVDLLHE